jgi:DNA polymerase-3 subunit chi
MGALLFYHLVRGTAEATARQLLARALAQGWPVMVRGTDEGALARLDAQLWLGPEEEFLPHGLAGGPQDARQPVLLGTGAPANGARALMLVDGALAGAEEVRAMERVWVLFDGADPDRLAAARAQWTWAAAEGLPAQYWSDEGGRWEKRAERA